LFNHNQVSGKFVRVLVGVARPPFPPPRNPAPAPVRAISLDNRDRETAKNKMLKYTHCFITVDVIVFFSLNLNNLMTGDIH